MKKIPKYLRKNWTRHGLEILAVFVDVLAAFSLSKWNETTRAETEAEKERKETVTALYNDLQVDINNLNVIIKTLASQYESAIWLLEVLETKTRTKLDEF